MGTHVLVYMERGVEMLQFKIIYGPEGYEAARAIREQVFLQEQGFPYDADAQDDSAYHIAGWDGERLIAAGRLFHLEGNTYSIGRVAVDAEYRGQYVGDTIMRALEDKAVQLGAAFIELHAQEQAVGFYEKQGYEPQGAFIPGEISAHLRMVKDLSKIRGCGGCKR